MVQPTAYLHNNPPLELRYCPKSCGGDSSESNSESAKSTDLLWLADASEELGLGSGGLAEAEAAATAAGESGTPPDGWQQLDYGPDNKAGVSDFTHINEAGKTLEATFYHDTGELQISWMDSLSQARSYLPSLVDWLGESVQTVRGYVTDNLATYFSDEPHGISLINRMFSSVLEGSGFAPGTTESEGGRLWLIFRRLGN